MPAKNSLPVNIANLNPTSCVNSKLRKLARMTTNIYERNFKEFELRSSQVSIMLMIGKMGAANQKELADFLFVDYSTMSRDLNSLKKRQIIKISKGPDARHSILELTESGQKLLERLVPVWKQTNDEIETSLGSFSISNIDLITQALKQHITR